LIGNDQYPGKCLDEIGCFFTGLIQLIQHQGLVIVIGVIRQ
jgi:hypothetical protein